MKVFIEQTVTREATVLIQGSGDGVTTAEAILRRWLLDFIPGRGDQVFVIVVKAEKP